MRNYVKCVHKVDKHGIPQTEERNLAETMDWVPCRFDKKGWKYQDKGTLQPILNHPNKINYVGGYGTNLSLEKMKDHFLPATTRDQDQENQMVELKNFIDQMND